MIRDMVAWNEQNSSFCGTPIETLLEISHIGLVRNIKILGDDN